MSNEQNKRIEAQGNPERGSFLPQPHFTLGYLKAERAAIDQWLQEHLTPEQRASLTERMHSFYNNIPTLGFVKGQRKELEKWLDKNVPDAEDTDYYK